MQQKKLQTICDQLTGMTKEGDFLTISPEEVLEVLGIQMSNSEIHEVRDKLLMSADDLQSFVLKDLFRDVISLKKGNAVTEAQLLSAIKLLSKKTASALSKIAAQQYGTMWRKTRESYQQTTTWAVEIDAFLTQKFLELGDEDN